jgi:hypothetical protein
MNAENCPVAVLETASKAPPTLRAGDVTPEIARRFEYACKNYIADKGIKEDEFAVFSIRVFMTIGLSIGSTGVARGSRR